MSVPGEPPRQWATAGPSSGDVAYRMQGLRYGGVELALDESVSVWTILRLWVSAGVCAFLVWAIFAFLGVLSAIGSDSFSDTSVGGGLFFLGSVLSFITFWVVLLLSTVDEPIAEWKTLVEDRYEAADSAYAVIYGTLRRRGFPLNANAVRIRSDVLGPESVNNRLLIQDRNYSIYVSVFPYGSSLYLGWMMWRSRRGAILIGHFIKDLFGGMLGRTGSLNQMLRTEWVRAMREAVHAAVREGAEVAMQGVVVPMAATFGQEVPVQDLRAGAMGSGYAPAPMPSRTPPSGGRPPSPGSQTPPAGAQTSPAGGQVPSSGAQTSPAGGQAPSPGGQTQPPGGQTQPPGGQTPPAGGPTSPPGGQTPTSGPPD